MDDDRVTVLQEDALQHVGRPNPVVGGGAG